MPDLFKNKYRIKSARAEWWDYGSNAAYFITICTAGRRHYFGEISAGKMHLSQVGVIADILWHEIPNHSSFVELGEFVVMPNHIHGVLILDKPDDVADGDTICDDDETIVVACNVSTRPTGTTGTRSRTQTRYHNQSQSPPATRPSKSH